MYTCIHPSTPAAHIAPLPGWGFSLKCWRVFTESFDRDILRNVKMCSSKKVCRALCIAICTPRARSILFNTQRPSIRARPRVLSTIVREVGKVQRLGSKGVHHHLSRPLREQRFLLSSQESAGRGVESIPEGLMNPEDVARFPLPGTASPISLAFSPDDNILSYLHAEGGQLTRQVHLGNFCFKCVLLHTVYRCETLEQSRAAHAVWSPTYTRHLLDFSVLLLNRVPVLYLYDKLLPRCIFRSEVPRRTAYKTGPGSVCSHPCDIPGTEGAS